MSDEINFHELTPVAKIAITISRVLNEPVEEHDRKLIEILGAMMFAAQWPAIALPIFKEIAGNRPEISQVAEDYFRALQP